VIVPKALPPLPKSYLKRVWYGCHGCRDESVVKHRKPARVKV